VHRIKRPKRLWDGGIHEEGEAMLQDKINCSAALAAQSNLPQSSYGI